MNQNISKFIFAILFILTVSGCDDLTNSGGGAGPSLGFVITSDSGVGNLSTITSTTPRSTEKNVLGTAGLHSDSVIRAFGNFIYILQRLGANSIVVIDPSNPSTPIANYTTNDTGSTTQSNPHDMAFVSDSKAYISRYALNTILIVNPLTGEQLGTIDLSQFADSDGIVEMDQMVLIGNKLFISLQRLDRDKIFSPSNDSYLVVIDTNTDQVIETSPGENKIILSGRNSFSVHYLASTDRIYVANVGFFSTTGDFGGIESIDPNTGLSEGMLIHDDDFNGSLGTIAILSETIAYATVFDASFNNFVVPFNLTTQQVDPALTGIGSGFIPSLAFDKAGFLYVTDRDTANPGLQVFETTTNQKEEGPIDTGLSPNDVIFINP